MTTTLSPNGRSALGVGATFAGYRIDEVVDGRRSAGGIYVATCLESGRPSAPAPWLPVALKVFEVDPSRPPWSSRVLDMARLQAELHHPNVVPIYEFGTSPAPFLSMALVRGASLAELLATRELDDLSALEMALRVASALEAARRHGLVYRDLRPSRVLLAGGDPRRACLGDFGAGRPEEVEADVPSNVRSLASMLFECLTFESPEHGARPLRELRGDLPAELEAVLAAALDEDPARRPPSAGALMYAVDAAYPDPHRRRRPGKKVRSAPAADTRASVPREGGRKAFPLALALTVAVACAALLGAIVAASLAPEPADRAASTRVLDAGSVSLRHPADWARAKTAPDVAGLSLREEVALAPSGDRPAAQDGRAVVVGSIESWDPELFAGSLAESSAEPPTREPVELGVLQGYRYSGVRPAGSGREANVYLLATDAGATVVGCLAPAGSGAFMAACERVASTLELNGARPVALAPSPSYGRALRRILSALDAARRSNRQQLLAARTPAGQAAVAGRLSRAYRGAERSAAALTLPVAPKLHSAIVEALGSAADAYAQMGAAARKSRRSSWSLGRDLALSAERQLQRSLRDLSALG